jgi:hypothetical protein
MSCKRLSIVVGFCLAVASVGAVGAAEPLQVGVARIDITPNESIRLSGYGNRKQEISDVAGKLSAKALAISGAEQRPVVLITVDLVGISTLLVDELAGRLSKKAGLERSQLAVCASHTHSGPHIKGTLPFMFSEVIPQEHQQHVDRYAQRLVDALEKVALDALADRQPAQLAWSVGKVTFAANRRKLEGGVWKGFGVNPQGPVDHALPVLRVTDGVRQDEGRADQLRLPLYDEWFELYPHPWRLGRRGAGSHRSSASWRYCDGVDRLWRGSESRTARRNQGVRTTRPRDCRRSRSAARQQRSATHRRAAGQV